MIERLEVTITSIAMLGSGFIAESKDGQCVLIDSRTVIAGCKLEYLTVGDELTCFNLTHHRFKFTGTGNQKQFYKAKRIELKYLEEKWNDVLKKDTKYSIDHSLDINNSVIRPEIIKPTFVKHGMLHYEHFEQLIENNKIKNSRHKKIIELHLKGFTTREIADQVKNCSYRTCARVIKKYEGFDR